MSTPPAVALLVGTGGVAAGSAEGARDRERVRLEIDSLSLSRAALSEVTSTVTGGAVVAAFVPLGAVLCVVPLVRGAGSGVWSAARLSTTVWLIGK